MKKIVLVILFLLLFPSMVFAKDTCNNNDIIIEEIKVEEKGGYTEELIPVNIDNNIINLNLEMYNVGESITYKIKVKNNSNNDYYFTKDSFNLNTDHIEYEILNNSAVIKPNEEKEIELKITYKNKTPEDEFTENNMMSITLSDTPLSNPSTKRTSGLLLLVTFIIMIMFINRNKKLNKVLIGIIICSIPLSIKALCTINLEINANITINEKEAIFLPGPEVNAKMKELAGIDTSTSQYPYAAQDNNITSIKYSNTEPIESNKEEKNIVSTSDSPYPIYMWYEDNTIYWWSEDAHPSLNENSNFFFHNMRGLNNIESLSSWETSNAKLMTSMFYYNNLSSLTSLSEWDVSNATSLAGMFGYNDTLTSLEPLSNWNISNVTNINSMFVYLRNLESLEGLENWNTSNVKYMSGVFTYTDSIQSLEPIRNWDTSNVIYFSTMFAYNNALSSLEPLRNWNVSSATNYSSMFNHCISLTSLQGLEKWNTSSAISLGGMFHNCVNLMDASAISNWDISNVENLGYMFNISNDVATTQKYSSLPKLDIKNWDTSKVKDYAYFIESLRYVETEFTVRNPNIERYYGMLYDAANKGGKIIVNYTAETEAIVDQMIETKSANGNIVKGSLVE